MAGEKKRLELRLAHLAEEEDLSPAELAAEVAEWVKRQSRPPGEFTAELAKPKGQPIAPPLDGKDRW